MNTNEFPSPHPGIINFFARGVAPVRGCPSFRPLIRGLSISSVPQLINLSIDLVSVPSSGDYQFLHSELKNQTITYKFPSPHPGIINFFFLYIQLRTKFSRFRPLIRGLSISSQRWYFCQRTLKVSVPSSGDYQFLLDCTEYDMRASGFPSPHPGIINFFGA